MKEFALETHSRVVVDGKLKVDSYAGEPIDLLTIQKEP